MEIKINEEALNLRFKKLNEIPEEIEEPRGICETIDAFVWGKQSWQQKTLSSNDKILKRVLNG